jgi:anti-sigma regulatory factor (Ser/Thr protein kinase)
MQHDGEASAPDAGFVHSALIYGSDDEFMQVALPFVEQGIAAGEPSLVAIQARNVEHLRAALGGEPAGVSLLPVEEWYESSVRTRDKFVQWAGERAGSGRVRLLGEPPWSVGSQAQIREWARYESIINVAFADLSVSFACLYDSRTLTPEILEHARNTHPEIVGSEGSAPSETYEDPLEFCERLDSRVERPKGEPAAALDFDLADLRGVRQLVASSAVDSGMPRVRADELALAVNEIASNAVVHGSPPATLRIWKGDSELICEVTDAGEGIEDVLAGQLTPQVDGIGGRGIWLARMLSDAVEIRNGTGCTVSIHVAAPEFALTP